MPSAKLFLISFKPLTSLYLQGYGDRTPHTPGPGQIPGRDPLLPRIETLIGAIVDYYYRSNRVCDSGNECSWDKRVFKYFLKCLGLNRDELIGIYGPFLTAKYGANDEIHTDVFIDVGEGLLNIWSSMEHADVINNYIELYNLWIGYYEETFPRKRYTILKSIYDKRRDIEKHLVSRETLIRHETGIMINPLTKSTGTGKVRGMIYGRSSIDYYGAVMKYLVKKSKTPRKNMLKNLTIEIILPLLVKPEKDIKPTQLHTGIGPKRGISHVRINISNQCIEYPLVEENSFCIVTSPMPEKYISNKSRVLHPLTGGYPSTIYARGFSVYEEDRLKYYKTQPIPAVERGAIVKGTQNYKLKVKIKYCISTELLRRLTEYLAMQ